MADDKEVDPTDESAASAAHSGSGDAPEPRRAKIEPEDEVEPYDSDDEAGTDESDPEATQFEAYDAEADESAEVQDDADNEARSADDSDAELVGVGASTVAGRGSKGKSSSGGGSGKNGPGKKDKATPKQRQQEKVERTTPVKFVGQSVAELRKVVYPTGNQLIKYFLVVLVFVLFIIGIVSLLDLAFGWAIFQVFA